MSESDDGELTADIVELTEGWSLCNDDMYRIANQLVSLAFANKYFGADSNRQNLLRVCEAFYQELCALGDQVELRPNFDYERVYQLLIKILNSSSDAQDSEDVLVEEDKSTLFAICPISRRPITHPVSQRFSHGDDSCDHVFDHASITDLIRSSKGTNVNCPVAACNKKVYESRLHRDWESVHWRRHQEYLKSIENTKHHSSGGTLYL